MGFALAGIQVWFGNKSDTRAPLVNYCINMFINCNKCTLLVLHVNNGGNQVGYRGTLCSHNFSCKSKTILKQNGNFKTPMYRYGY